MLSKKERSRRYNNVNPGPTHIQRDHVHPVDFWPDTAVAQPPLEGEELTNVVNYLIRLLVTTLDSASLVIDGPLATGKDTAVTDFRKEGFRLLSNGNIFRGICAYCFRANILSAKVVLEIGSQIKSLTDIQKATGDSKEEEIKILKQSLNAYVVNNLAAHREKITKLQIDVVECPDQSSIDGSDPAVTECVVLTHPQWENFRFQLNVKTDLRTPEIDIAVSILAGTDWIVDKAGSVIKQIQEKSFSVINGRDGYIRFAESLGMTILAYLHVSEEVRERRIAAREREKNPDVTEAELEQRYAEASARNAADMKLPNGPLLPLEETYGRYDVIIDTSRLTIWEVRLALLSAIVNIGLQEGCMTFVPVWHYLVERFLQYHEKDIILTQRAARPQKIVKLELDEFGRLEVSFGDPNPAEMKSPGQKRHGRSFRKKKRTQSFSESRFLSFV